MSTALSICRLPLVGLCMIVAMALPAAARAHSTEESYVFLSIEGARLVARVEMTIADVNAAVGLALPTDGAVRAEQLAPHAARLRRYVEQHLAIHGDDRPLPLRDGRVDVFATDFAQFVQVSHEAEGFDTGVRNLRVRYTGIFDAVPEHRAFLVVENDWRTSTFDNEAEIAGTFRADRPELPLDLTRGSVLRGFTGMVEMGIHHIWIGLDHVLFLLALLLPSVMRRGASGGWEPEPQLRVALMRVVKVVTVFTVAHTITLSLATLDVINLPARLLESIIAVSIAVVALDILFPIFRQWVYTVVLAFGLFHGLGFAEVLAELPIPPSYLVASLLGFNLGVEIGQLVIVCIAVPILFLIRRLALFHRLAMPAGAVALILVSMYWFVERAFDVDLPAGALMQQIVGIR